MVVPYKDQSKGKKEQVANMFNAISPQYDFLNHLLSGGIDIIWRKKAIKLLQNKGIKTMLDIATGTGDFAIEALKIKPERLLASIYRKECYRSALRKSKKWGWKKRSNYKKEIRKNSPSLTIVLMRSSLVLE